MGLSVGGGAAIGYWLDGRYGTQPWLTLTMTLIGTVAAFRALFVLQRRFQRDQASSDRRNGDEDEG